MMHRKCSEDERAELNVPAGAHALLGNVDVAPWLLKLLTRHRTTWCMAVL